MSHPFRAQRPPAVKDCLSADPSHLGRMADTFADANRADMARDRRREWLRVAVLAILIASLLIAAFSFAIARARADAAVAQTIMSF